MITLEQVEKLRERANVSYDEAKAALEESNGDLLEALINLEKRGSVTPPEGGGYYSSQKSRETNDSQKFSEQKYHKCNRERRDSLFHRFFIFCKELIHKGNVNSFQVSKDGEEKLTLPVTILVISIFLFFWVTVPLLVIGLFCGFTYRFIGPDLGKESMNNVMDTAANAAENIKKSIMEEQDAPKE